VRRCLCLVLHGSLDLLTIAETRTLLTLPEIRDELWKSVFSGTARERLLSGGARIGAF
jgi:hypothetical protein